MLFTQTTIGCSILKYHLKTIAINPKSIQNMKKEGKWMIFILNKQFI